MTGEVFEPIGNPNNHFSGKFYGKGFAIKGISVNADSYIGLFGFIENAFINDVGVEDANYTGWSNIGGIAGCSQNSVITNCYTRGHTNGNDCVGALVGYAGTAYSGQGFYVSGTAFPYNSAYNWYLYMDTDPNFGMYGYNKTRGQTIRPVKNLSTHIDGIINDNSVALANIYTLDGRLVLSNTNLQDAAKRLPKGIYVTNGKKFMVK